MCAGDGAISKHQLPAVQSAKRGTICKKGQVRSAGIKCVQVDLARINCVQMHLASIGCVQASPVLYMLKTSYHRHPHCMLNGAQSHLEGSRMAAPLSATATSV